MSATHAKQSNTTAAPVPYLALELSWNAWKLALQGLGVHEGVRRLRWQWSVGLPSGHHESAAVISRSGGSSVLSGPSA